MKKINQTRVFKEEFWHSLKTDEVFDILESNMDGLKTEEIKGRKETFGVNALPKQKVPWFIVVFFKQFINPMIVILLAAAAVSLIIREPWDAFFILIVVLINSLLGSIQEWNAEKNASSLSSLLRIKVRVRRNFKEKMIDSEDLVPGDIILIGSGDKVAADIRLLKTTNLTIDESFLTGESIPCSKHVLKIKASAIISERDNMCFAGSKVLSGRAIGIVVETGLRTEVGKIAEQVIMTKTVKSPLVIRMEKFTKQITLMVLIFSALFAFILYSRGYIAQEIFFIVVALAISAIPEGLPVALTVALSVATSKMLKKNVVVRKLNAVESLGSCTVIASDKTGTLTVNQQTVRNILLPDGSLFDVSGEGYNGIGEIIINNEEALNKDSYDNLIDLIKGSMLTNEGRLEEVDGKWNSYGDYMDVGLLAVGYKAKIDKELLRKQNKIKGFIPYESENKYSASFYDCDNKIYVAVKGAVETIVSFSTHMKTAKGIVKIDKKLIEQQTNELASKGYRVLAIATSEVKGFIEKDIYDARDVPELTFLGLVAFIDPLRKNAISAVKKCHRAGIKVMMVTGDYPSTAKAIACELGILGEKGKVITGAQLDKLFDEDEAKFDDVIKNNTVFARITPTQKSQIIISLRNNGEFVAVTGDGVNDAPALQKANIGVAMGSGTDVAKETSSMIIIDDDFSSIVDGVEEGRYAYDNVRKVISLSISQAFAEILLFLLAIIAHLPLPFLAIQLLWLNLVTNGIQDVALAFEGGEPNAMDKKPRDPKEKIFDYQMIKQTLVAGLFMGVVVFGLWYYLINNLNIEEVVARNYVLLLMVLMQNIHVFNCRSEHISAFKIPIKKNIILVFGVFGALSLHIAAMNIPFMQFILKTSPITFSEGLSMLLLAIPILFLFEIIKYINNRRKSKLVSNI